MKRIIILVSASVFLLVGCAGEEESSVPTPTVTSEYIENAHDMLDNYVPSEDVSEQESKEDTSADTSDISDTSGTSSEDASKESNTSSDSSAESENESNDSDSESSDEPSVKERVFLVTADISYEDGTTATLVCTSSGEVDLYFGTGTSFTDMETDSECLKRGMALIEICEKYLDKAEKVDECPLPDHGNTYVYMKTAEGIYRISYTNTEIHLGMAGDIEIRIINAINNITKHAQQ